MRVTFDKVELRGTKSGKCVSCGKRRRRATTVYQTLNPFNKGTDGLPKTREQIYVELREKLSEWRKQPIDCCFGVD